MCHSCREALYAKQIPHFKETKTHQNMWLTKTALCMRFVLPINQNLTWLKQRLHSNKNQPLIVFLLESALIQKFPT